MEPQGQASADIARLRSEREALLRDKEQLKASLVDLNATQPDDGTFVGPDAANWRTP